MAAEPKSSDEMDAIEANVVVGVDGPAPAIDDLVEKGDAESLIALALAHRTGTAHVAKDAGKALECLAAAASLGHPEAERVVGVTHFRGLGVPVDQARGAAHLRTAAQNGSLAAKVFVANLYEMGIHYAADAEKADVWYRNVARAAGIQDAPGTREYAIALAELGCVRDCLKLMADESLPSKERAQWLKLAKTMGYAPGRASTVPGDKKDPTPAVVAKSDPATSRPQPTPTPAPKAEAPARKAEAAAENAGDAEKPGDASKATDPRKTDPAKKAAAQVPDPEVLLGAQWTVVPGVLAFLLSGLFALAAFVAGSLATIGARSLASTGSPLPLIGNRHEIVLLAVVLVLGLLPAAPLYRGRVYLAAFGLALAAGTGGWFLFDAWPGLGNRGVQSAVFALAGFLVLVLIGGVIGGTRARPPAPKEERKVHDPIRLLPPQYPKIPND